MSLPNTHFGFEYLRKIFDKKCKIFFIGIGGVSMNSLAIIAKNRGHEVLGYDKTESERTRSLLEQGISVIYESKSENVIGCDAVIYTVAIPENNIEYIEAQRMNIPVISRADFLGYIMCAYTNRIGVCGMHGKTTTTALLDSIFSVAGLEPTVNCGATMNSVSSSLRFGKHDYFIVESCEYKDSFLNFYPSVAVVLNIEREHVDYFLSMQQTIDSFARFMDITGENGISVVNADDENVMNAVSIYKGKTVRFGIQKDRVDYKAFNVSYNHGCVSFYIKIMSTNEVVHIESNYPGNYIVTDALAAFATAHTLGLDSMIISEGISAYKGVERRMQKCGETINGATVYSDYAHHPTEIESTLDTVFGLGYKKVYCIFQPHTYSRTYELFNDFVKVLSNSKMDEIVLANVYPARETNIYGVSTEKMSEQIRKSGKESICIEDLDSLVAYVKEKATEGELIFVMGAGDINNIVAKLLY